MKNIDKINSIKELIKQAQENTDININEWITDDELEDIENYQDLEEIIMDKQTDICEHNAEFVYYYDAIKFLMENDQSLSRSLELASEFGFQTKDLNSTLLATLLASEMNADDLHEYVLPRLEKLLEGFDFYS